MAKLIEAEGNAFFVKCKGIAVVLAAISGLTLGVLNWFKETRDPNVKVSYQELAKQVEGLSGDVQRLAKALRQQADEIATIQNWILDAANRPSRPVAIVAPTGRPSSMPAPPSRKPPTWDKLQQQVRGK
jgi:uncharacterized protein YsxB (DUF464 family)